jgi:hypothetical protein
MSVTLPGCGARIAGTECVLWEGHPGLHVSADGTCRWPPETVPAPTGRKDDAGKMRYTLLPWRALDEVTAVLEHGVAKYGEGNWREVPEARRRYIDATLRHVRAVMADVGEDLDRDSGRHHLAHAVCSLLFVLELDLEHASRPLEVP